MTRSPVVAELRRVALVSEGPAPVLTDKGREWLSVLEDIQGEEIAAGAEEAADLVLSTSGLVR
ncbi:MAG: hypothetical protein ACRDJJ_05215 [Actinomycetota bacterium]